MRQIFKPILTVAVALFFVVNATAQSVLPRPSQMTFSAGTFNIESATTASTNLRDDDLKHLATYIEQTMGMRLVYSKKVSKKIPVRLECTGTKEQAMLAIDSAALQGYRLDVTPKRITITAKTPTGLFYGLQTLRQMTLSNSNIPCGTINDTPRFAYRGLMIDCSRHFWTVDFIKKQLDAMSYFKMNRFHWHLVDGGGWRMEVKHYPDLTAKTAWRTDEDWSKWWNRGKRSYCSADTSGAYGGYYTQNEIRDIVAYASARHITVIPEIEMPGHNDEVTYAYPELSCSGKSGVQPDLCVGKEQTYTFLETVLKEVMELFPSKYIHIGGDEASRTAWETCPRCQKVMRDNGLKNTAELQSHFTHRMERFLNDNGRQLLGWDEIMEGELAPNATVMSWREYNAGLKAVNAGHRVVMTPQEYCYLNMYQDAPISEPKAQGGYIPLKKIYSFEPLPNEKANQLEHYIYGVQGSIWTEYIAQPSHLEYMLYPRLLAIAETGWTTTAKDYNDFRRRALSAVTDIRRKGYNTFDLANEKGTRAEALAPTNHDGRGKAVQYITHYSPRYSADGDGTLTDGLRGDWGFLEGRWQGFIDNNGLDIVIDMGSITTIRDISVDFMQQQEMWIYVPQTVTVSISDDGVNYTDVNSVTPGIALDEPYTVYPYRWQGNTSGRYVRVKATQRRHDGWIFTDEIIINCK